MTDPTGAAPPPAGEGLREAAVRVVRAFLAWHETPEVALDDDTLNALSDLSDLVQSAPAAPPAEGEALRRLPDEDVAALDPGIRDLVLRLRAAGFETTDSGDGVSKPADWYKSGEGMPFPHVVAQVTPANLQSEARRMLALLGDEWGVEATYYPAGETALLMTRPNDERLAELRAAQGEPAPSEPLLDAARAAVAAYWAPEPDSRHGRGRVMQSMINLRIAAGMPWPVEGGAARRVGAHAPGRCGGPTVCSWCAREK